MLRFKEFIEQFLSEAKIEHFSHIGLDANNPEHRDLVDAYNLAHSSNDKNVPRQPNQIKTFDQLKSSVAPHMAEIQRQRKDDKETQEAIRKGHASLEHDSGNGVRVYSVRNQTGGWAVGQRKVGDEPRDYKGWCTSQKPEKEGDLGMVGRYDPEGGNSHVIHLDKEKAPYKKIGIFGEYKENRQNFQHQGNTQITDQKWNELREKHGLDKIPALWGVRGIKMPEERKKEYSDKLKEKIRNGTHDSLYLAHAKRNEYYNDDHKKLLGEGLKKKIQAGTHDIRDLDHASNNGYLNDEHKNLLSEYLTKKIKAGTHTNDDIKHANNNGYLNDEHKNLLTDDLTKKIQAGTHTHSDVYSAKHHSYLTPGHRKLLSNDLTKKIKDRTHNFDDLWYAKNHRYLTPEHRKLLSNDFTKKIKDGTYTNRNILDARYYRYLTDEHKNLLSDDLTKKIKDGTHTKDDIMHARYQKYLTDEHKNLLSDDLTKKIKDGTHTKDDIKHARNYRYLTDEHKKLLG
jgi:hypothetical protein